MVQPVKNNKAFILATIIAAVLTVIFAADYFINKQMPSQSLILDQRINPNTASAQALAMLEGIGPVKAQNIVEFRQHSIDTFKDANDLKKISGIGPKTVQKIQAKLKFN